MYVCMYVTVPLMFHVEEKENCDQGVIIGVESFKLQAVIFAPSSFGHQREVWRLDHT